MKHITILIILQMLLGTVLQAQNDCDIIVCADVVDIALPIEGDVIIEPDWVVESGNCDYELSLFETLENGTLNLVQGPGSTVSLNCELNNEPYIIQSNLANNSNISCWTEINLGKSFCDFGQSTVYISEGVCEQYDLVINNEQILSELNNSSCTRIIDNVQEGTNTVTANNIDIGFLNGISSLDLVLMLRGITLGFESPIQAIVMDINNDQTVSTLDFLQTRRLILGIEDSSPEYNAVRLVRLDENFDNFNPFDMKKNYDSFTFDSNELTEQQNIVIGAYKVGDLNNSAFGFDDDELDVRTSKSIEYQDLFLEANEVRTLDFEIKGIQELQAALFSIVTDDLDILNVSSPDSDVMYNVIDNELLISMINWSPQDDTKISIELMSKKDIWASSVLRLGNELSNDVIYDDLQVSALNLVVNQELPLRSNSLFPNPTSGHITLEFDALLDQKDKAVFIYATDGKLVDQLYSTANQITINQKQALPKGLYIVQIIANNEQEQHKLIIH